jgi:hypothetical protein
MPDTSKLTDRQVALLRSISRNRIVRAVIAAHTQYFLCEGSRVGGPRLDEGDVRALEAAGLLTSARTVRRGRETVRELVCSVPGHAVALTIGRAESFC